MIEQIGQEQFDYVVEAGRALRQARGWLDASEQDFAAQLGGRLGRPIDDSWVAEWESTEDAVPAAVLLAALDLCGQPLERLRGGPNGLLERIRRLQWAGEER